LAQSLRSIDEATGRLGVLADDLLDVSRIRLGQLPLRPRQLDLAALARRVVERYRTQLGDPYPLSLEVGAGPAGVEADPDRAEQILDNLIDNAAKYSPGGGAIAVSVEPVGDGVVVAVRDHGIGLPSGADASIFEPFNRAANAIRDHLPGLGLGLYVCRSIAERHGGRIWAESPGEGRGTTVRLWLPREPPAVG
jgi:signal transduction histidine kinase